MATTVSTQTLDELNDILGMATVLQSAIAGAEFQDPDMGNWIEHHAYQVRTKLETVRKALTDDNSHNQAKK